MSIHCESVALDRGLLKSLEHIVPARAAAESFHWVIEPVEGVVFGVVYTDGSQLDGPSELLRRVGWSFVAVDRYGKPNASAYGTPPPWLTTTGGAEAWALFQACLRAVPETQYRVDCKPCV